MSWFWLALAAPALWSVVNHIDKYIISRYFSGKGIGSLVIFTGLSGFLICLAILIFNFSAINIAVSSAIIIALSGAILVGSYIPYLHALEKEEASWVAPFYQVIPVFSYFLAMVFLKEYLTIQQIIGSIFIVGGAMGISFNLSSKLEFKWRPFLLMMLSSCMVAVTFLLFKYVAVEENFWGTAFWEYIGGAVFALFLFTCIPLYHRQFIALVVKNKGVVVGINVGSELINIIAKMFANFASLLAPLALVLVVNGFQPIFVLIYGVILTLFIPKWGKENLEKKSLIQKIISILVICLGVYILFR